MEKNDLFYCYSPKLKNFLVHKKHLKYLHKGFHDEKIFISTDIVGVITGLSLPGGQSTGPDR